MRKLILSMMVSIDGFTEDLNKDISWHVWEEEMNKYMSEFFGRVDTILLGRISYQLMESYWPNAAPPQDDPVITNAMNKLPKLIFSKTLEKVEWNNSKLIRQNSLEEITRLKKKPGKDMVLFGGADLASHFIKANLIDEYFLIVNPVVLGNGTPLFKNITKTFQLRLKEIKKFDCGNVLMIYNPA